MSKRIFGPLVAMLLLVSSFYGIQASVARAKDAGRTILKFDTMVGVPRPYTGTANPIRGIGGGGVPWVVATAKGELKQSGELKLKVTGLVLDPKDPAVIASGRAGQNPAATVKAVVSCQSVDAGGLASVVNVATAEFPATLGLASAGGGNAEIEADVALPHPCIAPIVFVTSAGGAWFAATGF